VPRRLRTNAEQRAQEVQKCRDQAAQAAVEFVRRCWTHRHGGVLDCEDKFLVWNNRAGQGPAAEEKALAVGTGLEDMGWNDLALGMSGTSWRWLVFNYQRRPVDWPAIDGLPLKHR
jgi:hypothetical protein